jgi:hypothetical protein
VSHFQSPYLVDIEKEEIGRILKLDSIKDGKTWKNIDVLVFYSWGWWHRTGPQQPYELPNLLTLIFFIIKIDNNLFWTFY